MMTRTLYAKCVVKAFVLLMVLCVSAVANGKTKDDTAAGFKDVIDGDAVFTHGPQRPSSIPILPGMNVGRCYFISDAPHQYAYNSSDEPYFEPADSETFGFENGPGTSFYQISVGDTSAIFFIRASDRPHFSIEPQGSGGGYAKPVVIPDLGVGGNFKLAVTSKGKTKWLQEFDSNYATMRAGEVTWNCKDAELGTEIEMTVKPFIKTYGCAVTAKVFSGGPVELNWSYEWSENIEVKGDYAMVSNPEFKYTQVYVGTEGKSTKIAKEGSRVRVAESLSQGGDSNFVCVWGYTDYTPTKLPMPLIVLNTNRSLIRSGPSR